MQVMTRKWRLAVTAVMVVAISVAAWAVDPSACQWAPKCAFKTLTGWQCPGCGISRAAHAAMHGRWDEALAYNWFFLVSIPYFVAVATATFWPRVPWRRYAMHRYAAYAYVVLFMAWWVVRNVAGW